MRRASRDNIGSSRVIVTGHVATVNTYTQYLHPVGGTNL